MTNRLDDTMRFHQTALNVRAYRQQVIASNIANADTPNFKARDVDFRAFLKNLGYRYWDETKNLAYRLFLG